MAIEERHDLARTARPNYRARFGALMPLAALLIGCNLLPGVLASSGSSPTPSASVGASAPPSPTPTDSTVATSSAQPTPGSGLLKVGFTLVTPSPAARLKETLTVTGKPADLAIDRAAAPGESDRVWVVREDGGAVTLFDLGGNELATYKLGESLRAIALAAGGSGWVQTGKGDLLLIDAFGDIIRSLPGTPATADFVVDADGALWIASPADGKVWRARFHTPSPAPTASSSATPAPTPSPSPTAGGEWRVTVSDPLGKNTAAIAIDRQGRAWVVNEGGDTLVLLAADGRKGEKTYQVGSSPRDLAIDADNNLWVASTPVQKWSPAGVKLQERAGLDATRIAIAPDGTAWIAEKTAGRLVHLASDLTILESYNVGKNPTGLAVDSLGTVWVANSGSDTITRLIEGRLDADAAGH